MKTNCLPWSSSCKIGPFADAASEDCALLRRLRLLRLLRKDFSWSSVGDEVRLPGDMKLPEPLKLAALRASGEKVSNVLDRAKLVTLGKDRSSSSGKLKIKGVEYRETKSYAGQMFKRSRREEKRVPSFFSRPMILSVPIMLT